MPLLTAKRLLTVARWFWILAPATLVIWLVVQDMVPLGRLTIPVGGVGSGGMIRGPVPASRVAGPTFEAGQGNVFRMLNEPIYFDVWQTRPFRTVTVRLSLDPGSADVIEFGVTTRVHPEQITLQPVYHRALEALAQDPGWRVERSGGVTLYQRGDAYASMEQFLAAPPDPQRVAAYRAALDVPFTPAELPSSGPREGTDFVLTGYQPLNTSSRWLDASATFALTAEQMAAEDLRIVVSVNPGQRFPAPWPPQLGSGAIMLEGQPINFSVLRGWAARWFRPS